MFRIFLLKVARGVAVAVDGADRSGSRVRKVTFVVGVTQGARSGAAFLAEARLLWTGQLGTLRIDTSVRTVLLRLFAVGVEASVILRAVRAGAGHWAVWRANRVQIALLTEFLEAVVWKLAVYVEGGLGGEIVILAYLLGRSPALRWANVAPLGTRLRAMSAA